MKGEVRVLQAKNPSVNKAGNEPTNLKIRSDEERNDLRKREHKALMKSLKLAQVSTASMGKFDRKVNKTEPDAPKSQKAPKKRSNESLFKLSANRSLEKDRNMKVFDLI